MNKEILMIIAMGSSGVCFALGGTGFKWARRFVLPVILAVIAILSGFLWLKAIIYGLALIIAFLLPYGQNTPYWGKFLTGLCFFAPALILNFTIWVLIGPILWILLFWLSNTKPFDKWFPWKIVEFLTGTLIGVTLASLISLLG